jgi:putative endonuclease
MEKGGWVCIMADRCRGGPYVGVTADAVRRVQQHRLGEGSRHVARYGIIRLVYVERHEEIEAAIAREKLVKKWKRAWKFALIEADNPDWLDLWNAWFPGDGASPQPEDSSFPPYATHTP